MLSATGRKHLLPTRRAVALRTPSRSSTQLAQKRPLAHVQSAQRSSGNRYFGTTTRRRLDDNTSSSRRSQDDREEGEQEDGGVMAADEPASIGSHEQKHEHAVISAFDLFSIGGMSAVPVPITRVAIGPRQPNVVDHSRPELLAHRRSHACRKDFHW